MRSISLALALIACSIGPALAQNGRIVEPDVIETVTLHRLFHSYFSCGEHYAGELQYVGDALGTDCLIQGGEVTDAGGFVRPFRTNGAANEDWYGWNAEVLAPFDGTVRRIRINDVVNQPGTLGRPPASMIVFERADGVLVGYAHVQNPLVAEGDRVTAGQVVAHVGNNGFSRNPHIHVGAWKDQTPYQIRWDLRSGGAQEPAPPTP